MTMPEERAITKQQLWERDERVRDASAAEAKDIESRLDQFQAKIDARLMEVLDEANQSLEKALLGLTQKAEGQAKAIEEKIQLQTRALDQKREKDRVEWDARIRDLKISVGEQITRDTAAIFAALKDQVKELEKLVGTLKEEVRVGLAKYHKSNQEQITAAMDSVNKLQARLSKMGELLR